MHGMPARHARRIANVASEPTVAPTDTVPCTFTALSTTPAQPGRWYLDSGVSNCRCREHHLVDLVQPCAQPHVAEGHDSRAPILGSGIAASAPRLQRADSLIGSTRWRTSASSRASPPTWSAACLAEAGQGVSVSASLAVIRHASRSSPQPTGTRPATSTAVGLLVEQRLAPQPPSPVLVTSTSSKASSASRRGGRPLSPPCPPRCCSRFLSSSRTTTTSRRPHLVLARCRLLRRPPSNLLQQQQPAAAPAQAAHQPQSDLAPAPAVPASAAARTHSPLLREQKRLRTSSTPAS